MAPSAELLAQLKRHEGLGPVRDGRTYVYRCTSGCRTVGFGHNLDASPLNSVEEACTGWDGSSITLAGAAWLLELDASRVCSQVVSRLPWVAQLCPARRDALCNMAYQMGIGGLLEFKQTLRMIRIGAYALAAQQMARSKWACQTPGRARELARQIRSGRYAEG